MKLYRNSNLLVVLAIFAAFLFACGGEDKKSTSLLSSRLPEVTSNSATIAAPGVVPTDVTLSGTLNPKGIDNTTVWFEWGSDNTFSTYTQEDTIEYGASPVPSPVGSVPETVTAGISVPACGLYYYRLAAENPNGPPVFSDITSFLNCPSAPLPVSNPATGITPGGGATLNGEVNPGWLPTTFWFEYGADSTFAVASTTTVSALSFEDGASHPISSTVTGLTCSATYYFRVVAENSEGAASSSPSESFIACAEKPGAITHLADNFTGDAKTNTGSATLNGSVVLNGLPTEVYFLWGTDDPTLVAGDTTDDPVAHGALTPVAGNAPQSYSTPITGPTGLSCGTIYYRLVAKNDGGIDYGEIRTFDMCEAAPDATVSATLNLAETEILLGGTVTPNQLTTNYKFQYSIDGGSNWTQFGSSVTLPSTGWLPVPVTPIVFNALALTPGQTYNFRLVADNTEGTFESPSQSLTINKVLFSEDFSTNDILDYNHVGIGSGSAGISHNSVYETAEVTITPTSDPPTPPSSDGRTHFEFYPNTLGKGANVSTLSTTYGKFSIDFKPGSNAVNGTDHIGIFLKEADEQNQFLIAVSMDATTPGIWVNAFATAPSNSYFGMDGWLESTPIGGADILYEAGKWYTLEIDFKPSEIVVTLRDLSTPSVVGSFPIKFDGTIPALAAYPGIDVASFAVWARNLSVTYDNIKVIDTTP